MISGNHSETPLTKADKKAQEDRILNNGVPTVSLRCFVDEILRDELEDFVTLPALYQLIEEYGLKVYEGVIDAKMIASDKLLASLRHREQEAEAAFGDADFRFWQPFLGASEQELSYTLFREDVARAYLNAGKNYFPWLSWNGNKVELDVDTLTPFSSYEFGLFAHAEDYQSALIQDAWTWQEALCWLKGRVPDECRLHQLTKYYPLEIDLIIRAIKAKRMSADNSSPQEWIAWALEKGWSVNSLLKAHLLTEDEKDNNIPSSSQIVDEKRNKPRKRLIPQERGTTEGLLLVYEICKFYEVEFLDQLEPISAWGKIISGEFKSESIKEILDEKKIILTGGEKYDRTDFCTKYRGRFKLPI